MQNKAFHRILNQLDKLTFAQSKKLQEQIKYKCSIKTIEDVAGKKEKKGSGHKKKRGQDISISQLCYVLYKEIKG